MIANNIPDTNPPKCAKFATDPKPNNSNIPRNPSMSHTIINRYNPEGSWYLSKLASISKIIQYPINPYITPDNPPNRLEPVHKN